MMPDDLGISSDALTREEYVPKRIAFNESINRQLDRIAYLRSIGRDWSEALYQLRDMVVPFEDEEFKDGIPASVRSKHGEEIPVEVKEEYAGLGWETHPVRAVRIRGRVVFRPSSEDLSRELRIIMRLLDRRGFIKDSRTVSRLEEKRG